MLITALCFLVYQLASLVKSSVCLYSLDCSFDPVCVLLLYRPVRWRRRWYKSGRLHSHPHSAAQWTQNADNCAGNFIRVWFKEDSESGKEGEFCFMWSSWLCKAFRSKLINIVFDGWWWVMFCGKILSWRKKIIHGVWLTCVQRVVLPHVSVSYTHLTLPTNREV